jgi:hypothetical protein
VSARVCCELGARTARSGPRAALRRGTGAFGWVGPGAVMVLMPKCPACVAAYLAMAGVGVSFGVAAEVRWVVLGLCAVLLAGWAVGLARRGFAR